MPIANFDQFCKSFCETAGIEPLELAADAHGSLYFSARMQGVSVTALQTQDRPDQAYLMAELGPMPEAHATEGWRALMNANHRSATHGGHVFSCDPETGAVIVQCELRLFDISPGDVYEAFSALVKRGIEWQDAGFLPVPVEGAAGGEARSNEPAADDSKDDLSWVTDEVGVGFTDARDDASGGLVRVNIGAAKGEAEEAALIELMEANFAWMTSRPPLVSGRDPRTGDLFLQFADADEQDEGDESLLLRIEAILAWSEQWEPLGGMEVAVPTQRAGGGFASRAFNTN